MVTSLYCEREMSSRNRLDAPCYMTKYTQDRVFIYGFDLQTACDGTRGEGGVGFCRVRDGS